MIEASAAAREAAVQLLGDEGHHRMEQAEHPIEGVRRHRPRDVAPGHLAPQPGLDLLEVPVGESSHRKW